MRCVIGVPCGEDVKTSMLESSLRTCVLRRAGGWDISFFHCASGPYVQENLKLLLRAFLEESPAEAFLRLDTDMAFTQGWAEHFFSSLHLEHFAPDAPPVMHGGVYTRRREILNFVPCIQFLEGKFLKDAELYAQRIYDCYLAGTTIQASRVGGGWCVYNRAAAALPAEAFMVANQVGEDYGSCDATWAAGGEVWATFPRYGGLTELWHVEGTTLISIPHYLRLMMSKGQESAVEPAERS